VTEFPVKDLEMSPSTRQQTDTNHLMTNKNLSTTVDTITSLQTTKELSHSIVNYAGNTRSTNWYQK